MDRKDADAYTYYVSIDFRSGDDTMSHEISSGVWNILMCPNCGDSLCNLSEGVQCGRCQSRYDFADTGSLDLRLRRQKRFRYEFDLGADLLPASGFEFNVLRRNDAPEVDYSALDVPAHLSEEILTYFPRAKSDNSLALDLGCGNAGHRDVCEHAGFKYVGLDYDSENAPILGDAHSLPFKDDSFEFILSIAVLEHIRYPFVMMKEAYRVLKPNGVFVGTVAFLEPFHQDSFYHHTHLGTYNSLQEGGFKIQSICPSDKWSALIAQATMGLFPKMPRFLCIAVVTPLYYFHKLWWRLGGVLLRKDLEKTRLTNTTGAFTFIARKEAAY